MTDNTNAERQARFRAHQRERIAKLEADIKAAKLKPQPAPEINAELERLRQQVRELEATIARVRADVELFKARSKIADLEHWVFNLREEIEKDQRKIARLEVRELEQRRRADLPDELKTALLEKIDRLEAKKREQTAHIRALNTAVDQARQRTPKGFMEARTYSSLLAALHPDRALSDKRQQQAFQLFNNLKKTLVKEAIKSGE
jgi:hypothetical protein